MDAYERQLDLGERRGLPLPPARPRARARDPAGRARRRRDAGLLGGDAATVLDDLAETRPTHVPPSRACSRRSHARAGKAHDAGGVRKGCSTGRSRRAAGRAPPSARARINPPCAPGTSSPTASCCPRCAACSAAARARAHGRRADRGGGARVLRRLRRARAGGLRDDRELRRGDAQHAVGVPLRHRRPRPARRASSHRRRRRDAAARAARLPGYHRDPEATADDFDGDWLCTGDLGASTPTATCTSRAARRT